MPGLGFWGKLEEPIVGLAPMDGVTDAPFRQMICRKSRPSLVMTEFTNVEGLARGATKMLGAFDYDEIEHPIVAQLFGTEVDSYYKSAVMLCEMGFDGIDINMGCPAKKVAEKGGGAGLIKTPALAKEIVRACQRGCKDWAEGITMEEAGVHDNIIAAVRKGWSAGKRTLIPVSVKTRIGYDEDVAEEWMKHLLEVEPAAICVHGRTLKQMYRGAADWESIARAAAVCKGSGVKFLGNGDVSSMADARGKISNYEVDGVLVGRATFGNPWFFGGEMPGRDGVFAALIEHAKNFEKWGKLPFHAIRKHLGWYCKGFEGAKELRMDLMHVNNAREVESIINNFSDAETEA